MNYCFFFQLLVIFSFFVVNSAQVTTTPVPTCEVCTFATLQSSDKVAFGFICAILGLSILSAIAFTVIYYKNRETAIETGHSVAQQQLLQDTGYKKVIMANIDRL
jgi:uncharacterized membrane protein